MTVTVVHPQKAAITIPVLPGQTEAYTDAPIYAQTSGYLKKWYFDIGAKVKAGDVLVEFDGKPIDNLYDFTYALRQHKPGDTVQVKVLRGGTPVVK